MLGTLAKDDGRIMLSLEKRRKFRPWAKAAVIAAAFLTGVSIVLKVPMLAKYPGTNHDPFMRVASYTLYAVILGIVFKMLVVPILAPFLERWLGTRRRVRLRDAFHREIIVTAAVGGTFHAAWVILFYSMITEIAPSALAAGRACVVFALGIIELWTNVLERSKRVYVRLTTSVVVTLTGAAIAIFADGFHLFKGEGGELYTWLFILLIGPGNFLLAIAEQAELRGVGAKKVSSGTYTFARYVWFGNAVAMTVVVWGIFSGNWSVFWHVGQMCWDRWLLIVPIGLLSAAADLIRITVKIVIPATYMYVVGTVSVVVEGIAQAVAKRVDPATYVNVPDGWVFPAIVLAGGVVVIIGGFIFPHPRREDEGAVDVLPVVP